MTALPVSLRGDDGILRLFPEALDTLRGVLLAERGTWSARLMEYEATVASAPPDAFGAEIRQLAKASIARVRDVIDDIDHILERLVQTYGSCEWCDMVIPSELLEAIPDARLCRTCQRRAFRRRRSPSRARPGWDMSATSPTTKLATRREG